MYKAYWSLFTLCVIAIFLLISVIIVTSVLTKRGSLSKKFYTTSIIVSTLAIVFCLQLITPCIKDYKLVSNGEFLEEDALVVDFMDIDQNLDGNGEIRYSQPKFYIERIDEYVVLKASNVELGKRYRIRYLPNTKICEVLYCIES